MRSWTALLVAAAIAIGVHVAQGTTVVPLDLGGMVAHADLIVVGRVTGASALVEHARTITRITLGALTPLKGDAPPEVQFVLPGGTVGRYRTVVAGVPVLAVGDEVVAFFAVAPAGGYRLVGFSQGLLRVMRATTSSAPVVLAPPHPESATATTVRRGEGTARLQSLAGFVGVVRELVTADAETRLSGFRRPGQRRAGGQ